MSSFILSNKNFEYLKSNITKYMLSEEGAYIIFKFKYFEPFSTGYSNTAFRDFEKISKFVNKEVNYLHKINIKSFNQQYKEENKVYFTSDSCNVEPAFRTKLSEETLLQVFQILNCLDYQIEMEYDREFLDKVKDHIACTIARRRIDYINDCGGTEITWGL